MKRTRDYFKWILVGFNQTGKTFDTIKKAKSIIKADPRKKAIFITPSLDDETLAPYKKVRSFEELRRVKSGIVVFWDFDFTDNELFEEIVRLSNMGIIKNGFVVFDDATQFFSANGRIGKTVNKFLTSYRHNKLDILFIFHAFKDVPVALWRKVQYVSIKNTGESRLTIKDLYNYEIQTNVEEVFAAHQEIQKLSKYYHIRPHLKYHSIDVRIVF